MKRIIGTVCIAMVGLGSMLLSCSDSGSSDKEMQSLLLLAGTRMSPQQAASYASMVAAGLSSTVASSSSSGLISFKLDKPASPEGIMKMLADKRLVAYGNQYRSRVIPAALTRVSGAPCNSSGCNAVVAGTVNCPYGGTATLNNVSIAMSITNPSPLTFSFTNQMSGSITMANCTTYSRDYLTYPDFTKATVNGTMTYDGSYQSNITSFTSTATTASMTGTFTDVSTINGADLTINGSTGFGMQNVRISTNLSLNAALSNMVSSNTGGILRMSATVNDTLTGTTSVTGTVGGQPVSRSRTFAAESFRYSYACTINMNDSTGNCEVIR